jgi:hypothetical protein
MTVLSWEARGGSWFGFDAEQRLRAQVVRYDQPAGWVAFVRQERMPGRYLTAEEAKATVDGLLATGD